MARHMRQPHLEYRRSGFFWRRRVFFPVRFDPPFTLRFSLHTHDPVIARDLATQIRRLTDLAFEFARARPMQAADMHHVITELVRWKFREEDRRRVVGAILVPLYQLCSRRSPASSVDPIRQIIEIISTSCASNDSNGSPATFITAAGNTEHPGRV